MVNRESWGRRGCMPRGFWGGFWGVTAGLPLRRVLGYCACMQLEAARERLKGYLAADPLEAAYVARMLELTQTAAAAEREHFAPGHFTASGFVLSPDRRDLILIHHKKLGIWVQPGGHVEAADADLAGAARREVAEEVGLGELDWLGEPGALFDVDIHTIPARKAEPAHEHFDVRFAFVARTRDFTRTEEVADVRWVPLGEVETMGTDQSVLRAVHKLQLFTSGPGAVDSQRRLSEH